MSDDNEGCLLFVVLILILYALVQFVNWLGEGFHMSISGLVIALILLLWLWAIPAARRVKPAETPEVAIAGVSGAKPLLPLLAVSALYSALIGFTFFLGGGYGLLGLVLGGFGLSLIGWSWWRPFHIRIGPRLHFPWWVHLLTTAGVATVATLSLLGYVAGATAHHAASERASASDDLALTHRAMDRFDLRAAEMHFRRAKGADERNRGLVDARKRLTRLRRQARAYHDGKYAAEDRDWDAAIRAMKRSRGYQGADRLIVRYRRAAARDLVKEARREIAYSPSGALRLLREARRYGRVPGAGVVRARAQRALARERAKERRWDREFEESLDAPDSDFGGGGGSSDDGGMGDGDHFDLPFIPGD